VNKKIPPDRGSVVLGGNNSKIYEKTSLIAEL